MTSTKLSTISNSDMAVFSKDEIRRAGELLGVPLDEASAIKALIIQRDTGLSITRGEISIIPMGGKPTVFVNKQGYLAYAAKQPEYDGYEFGIEEKDSDTYAWCRVYRTDRTRPTYEDAWMSEDNKGTSTWKQMPKRMLVKVAIKRAHQAAFPVLNGLYDPAEAWDNPGRIEQRDDDIVIVPVVVPESPKPEPKQAKPTPTPGKTETAHAPTYDITTAQKIMENFVDRGFPTDIFDQAKMGQDRFNKEMIDNEFKRLNAAEKGATAKPKPEDTDWKTAVPYGPCSTCGKTVIRPDAKRSLDKFHRVLCPSCLKQELQIAAAKSTPPKPEPAGDQPVCSVCGKPVTSGRKDACEFMDLPITCRECGPDAKNGATK